MRYKIEIRRKDGSLLIKETNDSKIISGYVQTAREYGDKVIKIEELGSSGSWRPAKELTQLVKTGMVLSIGLGMLGAVGGAFKA